MTVARQGPDHDTTQPSMAVRAGERFAAFRDGADEAMGELVDLLTPLLWQVARSHGCSQR